MEIKMTVINFLINEVFVEAPVFLGLVALIGLLLQKKSEQKFWKGPSKPLLE
jgi:PTS system ascorbate-specific IIC component